MFYNKLNSKYPESNSSTIIFKYLAILFLLIVTKIYPQENKNALNFTVASYNVENLFDLQKNGTEYKEFIPFSHNWNLNTYHTKLENISNVLKELNADILVLTEVENINTLKALKKEMLLRLCNYKYYAIANDPKGSATHVSILSKYPITFSNSIPPTTTKKRYLRNMLEADIKIKNHTLKIFALHWPSKVHPESSRIEACQPLIKRLKELPDSTEYLIAGDLNSNYNEAETFYTSNHDNTNGITAINHILSTAKSEPNNPLCYYHPAKNSDNPDKKYHFDPWIDTPTDKRFSYIYQGSQNTLDHILISESLFDSFGISYINNSFNVFTWNNKLLKNGIPFRWELIRSKNGKLHKGEGYSDHLPIIATFSLSPYKQQGNKKPSECFTYNNPNLLCGFESGTEGWIASSNKIIMNTTKNHSASGENSLKVYGKTNINTEAIKYSFKSQNKQKQISFKIKGKGKIAILIKDSNQKTLCYTGSLFSKKTNSTRYTEFNYLNWTPINLDISGFNKNERLTIILKSYKNCSLEIFMDDLLYK